MEAGRRYLPLIGYVILALFFIYALASQQSTQKELEVTQQELQQQQDQLQELAKRLEEEGIARADVLCESSNETRAVLTAVLESLAAPRDDDEPGDLEERMMLFDQVESLLQPADCPPEPPENAG